MNRVLPPLLLSLAILSGSLHGAPSSGTWPFEPPKDEFSPDAKLDLRSLNESAAGANGFVRIDERGDFILGDGSPARFWGITSDVAKDCKDPELAHHARFLAKRGVNLVKVLAAINPNVKKQPDAKLTDIDETERDRIWRTVAAMKKEGIYTFISPFWPDFRDGSQSWGLGTANLSSLLLLDSKMQDAYCAWMKALLSEKNPYTGLPLAKDPAVAGIIIDHEDSLLFWTLQGLKGEPRARLVCLFNDRVTRKYGSHEAAVKAWEDAACPSDTTDQFDLLPVNDLTAKAPPVAQKRRADQMEFLTTVQRDSYKKIIAFLRDELGCRFPVCAGDWRTADLQTMTDAERYSYTAGQISGADYYFGGIHKGPNAVWAIQKGDSYTNRTALIEPEALPVNYRQTKGMPMLSLESSWTAPNLYAAEGPLLVAAYSSLTGFDGFIWFCTKVPEWTPPRSPNGFAPGIGKWDVSVAEMQGQFPAAALIYRKGYVKRGEPVLVEHRTLDDLWNRRLPALPENAGADPNPATGNTVTDSTKSTLDPRSFLVGPVEVVFDSKPELTKTADISKLIDRSAGSVRSNTGELEANTGKGFITVNAPCAQGAVAFWDKCRKLDLRDVSLECGNDYAAIVAVSLDGQTLDKSERILVQMGTHSRPTGWTEHEATVKRGSLEFPGFQIDETGTAPWQIQRLDGALTLRNNKINKALVLDVNGMAGRQLEGTSEAGAFRVKLPEDALYMLLTR